MRKNKRKSYKISQNYQKILNVKVISNSKRKVLRQIVNNVSLKRKFLMVTPNPEMLVMAQKDQEFARILNSAQISLADGIGLAVAYKYLKLRSPEIFLFKIPIAIFQGIFIGLLTFVNSKWIKNDFTIIKGRDMFLELIKLANKKSWKVFLFGGQENVSAKTSEFLKRSYKKVKIEFFQGPKFDQNAYPLEKDGKEFEKESVQKINQFRPQLLFVGLGAPKQEKWLYRWFSRLNIGGAMVVGGTFDYFAGNRKFPPKWLEKIGMEWLWRLLTGSQSIGRIINAVFIFPLKVFIYKLNS